MSARELITEHLDLWTGAVTHKSSAGRGRNGKIELTGIKKLRELILELAVRGKLVDQNPEDEPASVLLERIAEEKARLVREGKVRKPKSQPAIELDEEDFELPSNWLWVRLGSVGQVIGGGTPKSGEPNFWAEKEIAWLTPADLYGLNEKYIASGKRDISRLGLEKSSAQLLPEGSVLFSSRAPIGYVAISVRELATNQGFKSCVPYIREVNQFLYYFLKRSARNIDASASGTTFKEVSGSKVASIPMPLPPLEEQLRIVEKVDELMALCDRLEQQVGDQLEAHEVLVDTLLDSLTRSAGASEVAENWAHIAEHFDTLFTTEASIDKLKQAILQLAVMGRLVEQCPDDEPAESLLTRLASERQIWLESHKDENPECATMLRKLKKLRTPKPPFDLPRGWAAAHLIQLSKILVDCHNKTAPYIDEGIPIIRTSNIRERGFRFDDLKYVSEDTYQYWSRRCPPEPKDIIFTREAPMGEAAIIPEGAKWCLGQRTMLIRPMLEHINEEYLLLALTEPHLLERASDKAIGSTVKHLRVGDVERLSIPVPPLVEQNRIVDKVDELMALCDQLKARLGEAGETRTQLAEAVVEGGLN